jgi:hypothetical protein
MMEEWKGEREVEGMRGGKSQTLRPRSFANLSSLACLPGEFLTFSEPCNFSDSAVHLAVLTIASDQLIYF